MQNKNFAAIITLAAVFIGMATFIAGMLLTRKVEAGISFRDPSSILIPAPELPATPPQVTGPFIKRQDNTLILESKSLGADGLGASSPTRTRNQRGPQVEVLVTGETIIYRDTTDPGEPFSAENQRIQQTVAAATLDNLNTEPMVMVWGRKSGDRIIADVMIYSHTAQIKRALFENCEICP